MKLKLKSILRAYAFVLPALLTWSIWASAQSASTNAPDTHAPAIAPVATGTPGTTQTNQTDRLKEEIKSHPNYLTFGLDKAPFLEDQKLLGQPLWKYLASLIYIFLAFYASRFLDFLTNLWLKQWSARTGSKLNSLLVSLLRGPVRAVAFVVFLNVGLDLFDWGPVTQFYLSKGFILVVAISLTYVTLKLTDLLMALWRQRTSAGGDRAFDEQLFPVIGKSLKIFAIIVAVLLTASNLHINITAALASLSVGALAVGLAAQDTLANLFGAIAVYVDKPFRIGDQIRLDSVDGTVESIGLRSTRVRSVDGHHVTIPNKTVGNATITNITRRPNIKTEMNIGLTYDLPAEKVRRSLQILQEIYQSHPLTADLTVSFNKFADSSLNILVVHWWNGTDGKAQLAGMQELNLKIKERFDAEGITFAFPSRTLYVRQESDWRAARK
jgi:MscS family membrane protein